MSATQFTLCVGATNMFSFLMINVRLSACEMILNYIIKYSGLQTIMEINKDKLYDRLLF